MADIVDDILTRLHQLAPAVAEAIGPRLEVEVRQAWGGTEPYVGKRVSSSRIEQRTERLAGALQQGQTLAEAFQAAGLPRRTGYRLLKRPSRP